MDLQQLIESLGAICEGKSGLVEVEAQTLLSVKNELIGQAQLREDLQQARDEASMRPSVARKLNEKIRGLESELEMLRTNKKVKELEKKVQFLENELKQSYTTKNFTLKSGLLDLEKQYRAHMNVDPAMAAFWADVTVLLDENRDKDAPLHFKGPPSAAASSGGSRTPRTSMAAQLDAQQLAKQTPSSGETAAAAAASPAALGASANGSIADAAGVGELQSHPASGVQLQVEAFNTIISEETASAATAMPAAADASSGGSSCTSSGEVVMRHAGSFRIVRSSAPGTADAAPAAPAAPAAGSVLEEPLQPVHITTEAYRSKGKDVTFTALPANIGSNAAGHLQRPIHAGALDSHADRLCSSLTGLQDMFSKLSSTTVLPLPPAAAGSSEQQELGDVGSAWRQQIEQLTAAAQHLKATAGAANAVAFQQQQADAESLLLNVQQLREALAGSTGADAAAAEGAAAVDHQLAAVQQEAQQLLLLQQQAAREAGSQALLVQVFGEFLAQLEQQGVIAGGQQADTDAGEQQHNMLLELLQGFLQVNPQVPQLLASQLAAPAAAQSAIPAADATGATSAYAAVQSAPLSSPSVHASPQSDAAAASAHVATQANPPSPVHAEVQAEITPEVSHVGSQADGPAAAAESGSSKEVGTEVSVGRDMLDVAGSALPPAPPPSTLTEAELRSGSGIIYSASGSELSVGKVAVGQQLDLLHQLQRHATASGTGEADTAAAAGAAAGPDGQAGSSKVTAVLDVKPEDVKDLQAVAKELSKLRADNMELAASLQVTKSLVDHLNTSMKEAIDKADDAEAEAAQARHQLESATASLRQMQSENAELTKVLIDAKVEIAEKKGELLKLVRNLRRAVEKPTNAAGMVKELQDILSDVGPAAEGAALDSLASPRDSTELQGSGNVAAAATPSRGMGFLRRSSDSSMSAGGTSRQGSGGGRRVSQH